MARPAVSSRKILFVISASLLAAILLPGSAGRAATQVETRVGARALSSSLPRFSHVVVIVMENHEYSNIIGSSQAPYINALARSGSLATDYHAISHPSLPNYLALIGGSTFGISSDCTTCSVSASSLPDQFRGRGIGWRAYMQTMPYPCYQGAFSGRSPKQYAKKHDPFMYFSDIRTNHTRCRSHVLQFRSLRRALSRNRLPQFAWITPNLCNDMHSCSTRTGDTFLSRLVPRIRRDLGRSGILVITWDEGSTSQGCCNLAAGGHVVTIVVGPGARNVQSAIAYDHYSLLGTIERAWGLPLLRGAACTCSPSMSALMK